MAPIAVLGAGSWGTALALVVARNGYPVRLWDHWPAQVADLTATGKIAAFCQVFRCRTT